MCLVLLGSLVSVFVSMAGLMAGLVLIVMTHMPTQSVHDVYSHLKARDKLAFLDLVVNHLVLIVSSRDRSVV
jgi:hypothetical protein